MRCNAKIVFDVDNVLADSMSSFCKRASELLGMTVAKRNIKSHKVVGSVKLSAHEIFALQDEVWENWKDIPPTEENLAVNLTALKELGIRIIVATSGPTRRADLVRKWLGLNGLPHEEFYPLGPKSLKASITSDALVDDAPEQINSFVELGRTGFLYSQPWNRNSHTKGAIVISSILKVVSYYERLQP